MKIYLLDATCKTTRVIMYDHAHYSDAVVYTCGPFFWSELGFVEMLLIVAVFFFCLTHSLEKGYYSPCDIANVVEQEKRLYATPNKSNHVHGTVRYEGCKLEREGLSERKIN